MDLRGAISNLLSLGAKLLPAVAASALAPSSSSNPPVDQNHQINAELERLMRMLKRIKKTLYDAEQREVTDSAVKLWLEELRDVAYGAEDVLGEFHYEVLRAQVEGKCDRFCVHEKKEIKDLSVKLLQVQIEASDDCPKKKLIQVPSGMLYQIQQITSRFDEITKDRIALQLSEGDGPRRCNNELQIAPTSHFVVESNIFGRESEKKKLIELLFTESDGVSVVTIVGMGGIGKTTLAQLAYNDQKIRQRFDKFGWICVSESFNVERLTKETVESITRNECGVTNLSVLQEKIQEEIRGKRVLLVLDDVWNENDNLWNLFKAPFTSATFAKILVTTRNNQVRRIMQTEPTFNLGSLSAEQCWQLFEHYAFGGVEQKKCPKLVEIGKQIMSKCGMLPLAVKSIASLLRHEAEEESWRDILESELWESDVSNEIFSPLQISYARLPTYLKPCFLYCSMFPKDYRYNVKYMVKLWMSQGFIESKRNKKAEKIGFDYAQQLCERSFFDFDGSNEFKLHDIVHDLARLNSENCCYSIEVSKLSICPKVLLHLYIGYHVNQIDPILSDKFIILRTLIDNSRANFHGNFDFSMVPKLRALDLSVAKSEFLSSIGHLKHLCFLSLSDIMKTLPECICSLYSLQMLTLTKCFFKELPKKLENLISLEELIIKKCDKLEVLPESLCQLKALRELHLIDCKLLEAFPSDLGSLTNLQILKIRGTGVNYLPESLCQLKALSELCLIDCKLLEALPSDLGSLTNLQILEIRGTGVNYLPESLCQLKALSELYLVDCKLLEALPSDLGSLTNLQTLEIRGTGVSYLPPSLSKFVVNRALKVKLECNTIRWLKDFPDLGGTLCLHGLERISNLTDVQCANLVSMHNLVQLILSWDRSLFGGIIGDSVLALNIKSGHNILLESCFSVILSLQPHPNLRKLTIDRYHDITFPEWIGSLCKLKFLKIMRCDSLQFLKAEWLPLELEGLEIGGCDQLVSIPGIKNLKSLVKLSITRCDSLCSFMAPSPELTTCTGEGSHGSSLLGLTNLSSLRRLQISRCSQLQVLGDELPPVQHCDIEVTACPKLKEWCLQHGINYMLTKIVVKLSLGDAKKRTIALKTVATMDDVNSVRVDGDKLVVIGDGTDPITVTIRLRKKLGHADLISVNPLVYSCPYTY